MFEGFGILVGWLTLVTLGQLIYGEEKDDDRIRRKEWESEVSVDADDGLSADERLGFALQSRVREMVGRMEEGKGEGEEFSRPRRLHTRFRKA